MSLILRCFGDLDTFVRVAENELATFEQLASPPPRQDVRGFYATLTSGELLAWFRGADGQLRLSMAESVWLFEGLSLRCEVRGDETALIIDGMYRTHEAIYPTTHVVPPHTHIEDHDLGFFLVDRVDDSRWLDSMFRSDGTQPT